MLHSGELIVWTAPWLWPPLLKFNFESPPSGAPWRDLSVLLTSICDWSKSVTWYAMHAPGGKRHGAWKWCQGEWITCQIPTLLWHAQTGTRIHRYGENTLGYLRIPLQNRNMLFIEDFMCKSLDTRGITMTRTRKYTALEWWRSHSGTFGHVLFMW